MGILNLSVVEEAHKMKIFFFVLLVAGVWAEPEAEPKAEADPQYYGYALGHNLGYSGLTYGYSTLGYSRLGYSYPGYGYSSYAYPRVYSNYGYHSIGKREAEAEPEADPEAYYAAYGYAAPYAYGYNRLGYS